MELNKIICGDALYELRNLPNESVDMVMTSPPYYGLRDYGGIEGQLGLEKTFDEYLEKLLLITGEIKRVLKKEGSVFWNHGDSYNVAKIGNTNASTGGIGKPRYSGENLSNKKKFAVNVTTVPELYGAEHVAPQLIPVGLLVTVPDPVPGLITDNE